MPTTGLASPTDHTTARRSPSGTHPTAPIAMTQSAPDAYAAAHAEALALLAQLQQRIEDMPAPDTDGINWGHVGSMGHINAQLRELLSFVEG
jgi:hypothetical protein